MHIFLHSLIRGRGAFTAATACLCLLALAFQPAAATAAESNATTELIAATEPSATTEPSAAAEPNATTQPSAAAEQELLSAFAAASAAYESGDYPQAIAAFSGIAATAPSAAAYYNLGNAYYRNGQPGLAIYAYERANTYAYGQPGIRSNLAKARETARLEEPPLSLWQQYARGLSPNQWTLLLTAGFWCALGLWLIPALYRRRHGIWRPALLTLSVAVALLAAAGLYPWLHWRKAGIFLGKDTPVLLAPTTTSPVQTYAQPGQTAYRIRAHGNFDNVRLEDGSSGWVARERFAPIWEN